MTLNIANRVQRLENNYLDWDISKVRSEAEGIRSALDAIKQSYPKEVKKLSEQVRLIVADANMSHSFDEPERVSARILDIVRPIFFGICWGLFIVFIPLSLAANPITSITGLVFTLHMIIQSI